MGSKLSRMRLEKPKEVLYTTTVLDSPNFVGYTKDYTRFIEKQNKTVWVKNLQNNALLYKVEEVINVVVKHNSVFIMTEHHIIIDNVIVFTGSPCDKSIKILENAVMYINGNNVNVHGPDIGHHYVEFSGIVHNVVKYDQVLFVITTNGDLYNHDLRTGKQVLRMHNVRSIVLSPCRTKYAIIHSVHKILEIYNTSFEALSGIKRYDISIVQWAGEALLVGDNLYTCGGFKIITLPRGEYTTTSLGVFVNNGTSKRFYYTDGKSVDYLKFKKGNIYSTELCANNSYGRYDKSGKLMKIYIVAIIDRNNLPTDLPSPKVYTAPPLRVSTDLAKAQRDAEITQDNLEIVQKAINLKIVSPDTQDAWVYQLQEANAKLKLAIDSVKKETPSQYISIE